MKISIRIWFIALLAILFLPLSFSCSDMHQQARKEKKRQKEFAKEKERRTEASYDAYNAARKRHVRQQSKSARKNMKKTQKVSKRYNNHKKEFFLTRWFKNLRYKKGKRPINIE